MEWRDIKGYEGYYQVSDTGLVKAVSRTILFADGRKRNYPEKMLPIKEWFKNGKGYLMVSLTKHHKTKGFSVHRLVAEAFIPNPNNYPQINHKDEDKSNNRVDNLEWCDSSYNIKYSRAVKVIQFDKNGIVIKEWNCVADASRDLGIPVPSIIMCCQRKLKSYKGYFWRYAQDGLPNSIEDFEVSKEAKKVRNNYTKEYSQRNREKINAAALRNYHRNKEEINKKKRKRYQETIEERRKYAREYYKTHYKKLSND